MISVLLPTARRAGLLRRALQSVADQAARAQIGRVFVSENGGDRASEEVCRLFPQLPITYLFREPAVTPIEHGALLMRDCLEGEFAAILHDDDIWLPNHLADALEGFAAQPDAAAFGCKIVLWEGDTAVDRDCELFAWLGASYPAPPKVWRLSPTDVLLASLLGLVVHYSSLVARTAALAKSAFVYGLGNAFDNDRMILAALARQGPVLFDSRVGAIIAMHENRDTTNFADDERARRMAQTTEWLVESSGQPWPAVAALLARRLAACPDAEKKAYFVREATVRPWCLPEIARHLDRAQAADLSAL